MKLTFKGDYALKAIFDLTLHYGSEPVTTHDLASRIDAPVKFLEQVLLELKRGGFIVSKRGNEGGYLLSRAPGKITVGEVIRYIEGPIEPIACVQDGYAGCSDMGGCVFRSLWQDVHKAVTDIVDNVTFEQLVAKETVSKEALVYSI